LADFSLSRPAETDPKQSTLMVGDEQRIGVGKNAGCRHSTSEKTFENQLHSFTKIVNLLPFEVFNLEAVSTI